MGPALPQFKHGRYSKCFKDLALGQRYEECLANAELGELRDEIAVVDVMTSRILEELTDVAGDTADPKRLPSSDPRWALLLDTIEQRRKLVDSLRKNATGVVPVERVMAVHPGVNGELPPGLLS